MKHFITILLITFGFNSFSQSSAREIMEKVIDRPNGDTRYSELTMKLVNKRNRVRERRIKSYSMDIGKDTKKIMFFNYPGDVKGTGFLTWDYDEIGKDDDKWLYLPAMKKTRRISGSSAKTDYFMGSDFTYDDMGKRNVDEDTHKTLKEETVEGQKCWVIESTSKDKRDIYTKKISYIRQDNYVAVKVKYYDRLNKLHRILNLSEIEKIDGFWIAQKLHMENVQNKHKTILEIKNPKFNIKLKSNNFTVSKLKKSRI
jgi:hypothetical protein